MRAKAGIHLSLYGLAALALGGCASTPEPVIGAAAIQPVSSLGQAGYTHQASRTYLLRPSDKISVNVFREPDFSLEAVQIGVEGNVSLPLLGSIPAAGMTAQQFEADVTRRLSAAGLKSPMVAINIAEYASHLVTVEGAVDTPGVYQFEPGARLSSAIALAQGTKREAKRSQVAVFRTRPDGIYIAKFDYGAVSQGTMLDPVLEPGDRVVVGTDGLSIFWQDALQAIPALGVFATVAIDNN
ncbi:polysaccharide biosynthesis/export family protein [Erythrobacter sp. JK5]|uniref:polysaccharide biosynthesis/export family protein n=1 Tax=Erythrobacter sp. JK5 TaxID=2829500 RepID=UPI001BA65F4B|nr:polysaccharide biosynthesis/export family protein [Erythrobacter sp. JK5]QUL37675.1 polysaccharide export protein [Erythrobacter sp. JK5]